MALLLFLSFFVLMIVGVPVTFSLAISACFALFVEGRYPMLVIVKEMFTGLDSFPLMAVPFFILAADIMSSGAMTRVLLRFASQLVGHLRGGLGYANILSSTFFAGISGSALADAAGPGAMMIRMMDEGGYHRSYAGALTAATAVVGPIIPPSIIMILYAMQDESVSVGALFMAGILPGLLISCAMATVNWYISRKRQYRAGDKMPPARELVRGTIHALPALFLIVIIIGGIRLGVFTPTEASVIAVFYALLCGKFVYRSLRLRDLPDILLKSGLISTAVLLILAGARAFAWVLIIERIPQELADMIVGWHLHPLAFLLCVNILLLIFGLFMDPLPGVMILTPILAPIALSLGIDPIHFAIVTIVNLTLGMITPPVGGLLFVVSLVARIKSGDLIREMPPFMVAHLLILMLLTLVPALSTWLPKASGF
ncbi:TRAP transporter large permease [Rhodospirillum sp. A1_3_36]|uniref:TRAP transporter large permease n=1 Tax=Rhodospirillum sp. A1_3_36 TaxID=3391666 RepID=UPI0039A5209A